MRKGFAAHRKIKRNRRSLAAAVLVATPWIVAEPASAVVRSWIAFDGNWSNAANWSTGIVPLAGDEAVSIHSDLITRTITYDYTGPAVSLLAVRVSGGFSPASQDGIVQSANTLTTSQLQAGIGGRGSYTMSGGSTTVNTVMTLGVNASGRGAFNLSGNGNLSVGSIIVGASGLGTLNQSGGQFSATQSGVFIGQNAGSSGAYLLSGGSSSPRVLTIGQNGTGTFDHSGGFVSIGSFSSRLGAGSTGIGVFNLSGTANLSASESNSFIVGDFGAGSINHTGGTFNSGGQLTLGGAASGRGTYTLNLGSASAELRTAHVTVGQSGVGTFVHSAGLHMIAGPTGNASLRIASSTDSTGIYTLNGGTLLISANNSSESIGDGGAGTFVHTGGVHDVRGSQSIGSSFGTTGGSGTYLFSGGTFSVNFQSIGTNGRFIQSGGHSTVFNGLDISGGTYTLGGSGVLLSQRSATIGGSNGAGTFIQNGGTHLVGTPSPIPGFPFLSGSSLFFGGFEPGTDGYYLLAGGTLSGNGATCGIGTGGSSNAIFEQTGGTNDFKGLMVIGDLDPAGTGAGTYLFNGGSLAVTPTIVIDTQTGLELLLDGLILTDRGTFASNAPGGEFFGKFTHDGGTVTGIFRNRGTFVYHRGTFAAEMINRGTFMMSGTATFASPVTVTNEESGQIIASGTFASGMINRGALTSTGALVTSSISNSGSINIPSGTSLAPAFIDNFSRINLAGGRLLGSGTIGNNATGAGGVISGGGTIALNILQNGGIVRADNPSIPLTITSPLIISDPTSQLIVAPNARLNLLASFNNSAQVALQGPGARLTGATITNTGTIRGAGQIDNQIINNGIIRAEGGELVFTEPNAANLTAGQIITGANTVRFTTGLQTSNGTISLSGGEFDNGAGSLESSGRIVGRGTIRAGNLVNSGTIQLSGGVTDIVAPVTNVNRINISGSGATNFHGNVNTTVGTINVNLGSSAVFLGSVSGLDHLSGAGIKEFESLASGGGINTAIGSTVVGPGGNVTASFIRDAEVSIVGRATIAPNGTSAATSRIDSLIIDGSPDDWDGRLDLTNNDLVIDYSGPSPIQTVRNQIRSGFNGGAWTGDGITSSHGSSTHGLGFGEATSFFTTFPATFSGQSVDSTSVLIAFTRVGDANLDGVVNLQDFNRLASNFGQNNRVWSQGDFNYDGIVNLQDFNRLASNFGLGAGPDGVVDPADWANLAASVPEPSGVGFLVLLAPTLRRRARRA